MCTPTCGYVDFDLPRRVVPPHCCSSARDDFRVKRQNMAFTLSLLYLVFTFLSPAELFPTLAQYRPMVWLGLLAAFASVPEMISNHLAIRALQTRLLLALLCAMMLSEVAGRWFGGVLVAVEEFGPSILAFVLIVVNVKTMKRFRLLALLLTSIALVLTVQSLLAYHWNINSSRFVVTEYYRSKNDEIIGSLRRISGSGFLNDPNDFAQFLLAVLPLLWVSISKQRFRTKFLVIPGALLIYGVYLTHSRGAMVGMTVALLVALLPRMGKMSSLLAAMLLAMALLGSSFVGGRDVSSRVGESDESAHNRLEAWSEGLAMFKGSPLFGIGYTRFTEHSIITAHNSFVLCVAELGLVGATIWLALFVTTILALNAIAMAATTGTPPAINAAARDGPALWGSKQNLNGTTAATAAAAKDTNAPAAVSELAGWAHAMRVSISAFVATSWFLSRTYVTTLYALLGAAVALIVIATPSEEQQQAQRRNWLPVTGAVEVLALVLVYVMVRLRH